jgi:hypothetical protein
VSDHAPPPLTLDQASKLIDALGSVYVNTVMVSVSRPDLGLREHHVAIAPQQNFDVIETVRVLRDLGYGLWFVEVPESGEPRGFVITPPPAPIEEAEEVADAQPAINPSFARICIACGTQKMAAT